MAKKCIFILGGARSGKSHYAQELAGKLSKKVLFVATGEALDDEMKSRIKQHQESRPRSWRTLEAPTDLSSQIEKYIKDAHVVLIDCLTLLVANLLGEDSDYDGADSRITAEVENLLSCIDKTDASFIIVSNEVGMGVVPDNKTARIYRDLLGKANQLLAQHSDEVYFMVAGIPVEVKGDCKQDEGNRWPKH